MQCDVQKKETADGQTALPARIRVHLQRRGGRHVTTRSESELKICGFPGPPTRSIPLKVRYPFSVLHAERPGEQEGIDSDPGRRKQE